EFHIASVRPAPDRGVSFPPRVAAYAASLGCDAQRLRRTTNAAFVVVTVSENPEGVTFHSPGLARERLPRAGSGAFGTIPSFPAGISSASRVAACHMVRVTASLSMYESAMRCPTA